MESIVVGVDGSPASLEALAWAVTEARAHGAKLRVIHSWTFPAAVEGPDGLPHVDLAAAAEKVLDDALASVGDLSDLEVVREVSNELPAKALVHASEEADLVVVASRGRGGFAGLHLGSVAQQVTHHSKCPIVVIPHGR